MPELNGTAKDTEADGVVPKPPTALQMAALSMAGLVGGVVGAGCLGLVGVLIGASSGRGMLTDPSVGMQIWLRGMLGAVLGLPLGVAVGLRVAGRKLGIHGRFQPALAWSFAGLLASLGPTWFLNRQMISGHMGMGAARYSLFLFFAIPFVFALAGGLIGYLRFRRPRPSGSL
jgi:hypothetical protein